MRLSTVFRSLGSGLVVYVIAAACSSAEHAASSSSGGSGSSGGSSTSGTSASGGLVDAIVDGVANPVPEARAADVATEPCNKSATVNGGSWLYAVHEYPGKTIEEMSAVRVILHFAPASPSRPTISGIPFEHQVTIPTLRPGAAAVFCGPASGALTYDSAVFILP